MNKKRIMKAATLILFLTMIIAGIQSVNALSSCTDVQQYYSFEGNGTGVFENKCDSGTYDIINQGTVNASGYNSTYSQSSRSSDGTDYLQFDKTSDPDGTSDFTVSFWLNSDSMPDQDRIIGYGGRQIFIEFDNSKIKVKANFGAGWNYEAATTQMSNSQWYHVVLVYDTDTNGFQFYLDGSSNGNSNSTTGTFNVQTLVSFSEIFARAGANIVAGDVDEYIFFNKELNSTEINNLYTCNDLTCGGPPPPASVGQYQIFNAEINQVSNVTINVNNYINIFNSTVEINNRSNVSLSTTISILGEATNSNAQCRMIFDGDEIESATTQPPNNQIYSMYISDGLIVKNAGNYSAIVQCRKASTGRFTAFNGKLILNKYITPNGTIVKSQNSTNIFQTNTTAYTEQGRFNFTTTSNPNSTELKRGVIIEGQIKYNFTSASAICVRSIINGSTSDGFCRTGGAGDLGSGSGFWLSKEMLPDSNITMAFETKSTSSDGSVTVVPVLYEIISHKREMNITESFAGDNINSASYITVESMNIENKDHAAADIYVKTGLSVYSSTTATVGDFRITITGPSAQTGKVVTRNIAASAIPINYGMVNLQELFTGLPVGNYTINVQARCANAACVVGGGSAIAFMSNNAEVVYSSYNVNASNSWNNKAIDLFNVTRSSDGTVFSSMSGNIEIPRGELATDTLLVQSTGYFNRTYTNHNVLNNLTAELNQSILIVNGTALVTGNPVGGVVEINGTNYTSNTQIYPNCGNNYNATYYPTGGYFPKTEEISISCLTTNTFTFTDLGNVILNVSAREPFVNVDIANFTVTVTYTPTNYTFSQVANGLYVEVALVDGLSYSVNVSKTNFLSNVSTITMSGNQNYSADLAGLNNIFLTFLDEITLDPVQNVSFDVLSTVFSGSYNGSASNNFSLIGIPTGTYEIRYGLDSNQLAPRSYYFRIPIEDIGEANVTLLTIDQNVSSLFIRTVLDQNSQPFENGFLEVQRPYAQDNNQSLIYRTVEIALIDSTGEAVFTAVPNTQAYRFRVLSNLSLIRTFTPSFLVNTESELTVSDEDAVGQSFNNRLGVVGSLFYNTTGNYYVYDFQDSNLVSSKFCLNVSQTLGNTTTLSGTCDTSKSGTIIIMINESLGNTIANGWVKISGDNFVLATDSQTFFDQDVPELFKGVGAVLYLCLIVLCATMSAFVGIVVPIGLAIFITIVFGLAFLGLFSIELTIVSGLLVAGITILVLAKK